MEEKQLDFDAPLLSVRRNASTVASSDRQEKKKIENSMPMIPSLYSYMSELKSDEVSNLGAVPFMWEQIPGRPKYGGASKSHPPELPPSSPKLPPGRVLDVKHRPSEKGSQNQKFIKLQNINLVSTRREVSAFHDNAARFERSKEGMLEKWNSDSEDDDDTYSDALDTLSQTESFFLNCSVSGLSGLDGTDVKPSGNFSTDPQTRDFMMDRFLPAAKAMASETTQYASRKQKVAQEQPRQLKEASKRRSSLSQHKLNMVPQYDQYKEDEESGNEYDDYDDSRDLSARGCGLFPRFCSNNSLCLLNPVLAMKIRTRLPLSSVHKNSKQGNTTYGGPQCETNNEHTWDAVYNHKLKRTQQLEICEDESNLTSESNWLTYWSESQTADGSSSYRHSVNGGISPYRNEASQSPFREGRGFLGIPGEAKSLKPNGFDLHKRSHRNFQEMLSHRSSKQGSGEGSPLVVKTLYVDSVHLVDTPTSNSSSSDTKHLMDSSDMDLEIMVKRMGVEESTAVESSARDINLLNNSEERGIFCPKTLGAADANLPFYHERSTARNVDGLEVLRQHQGLDPDSWSLACSKVPIDGNIDFENQRLVKSNNQGDSNISSLHSLAPPLPKSPSESWLWRALPSISSRNASSQSFLGSRFLPRKQDPDISSVDQKFLGTNDTFV